MTIIDMMQTKVMKKRRVTVRYGRMSAVLSGSALGLSKKRSSNSNSPIIITQVLMREKPKLPKFSYGA